MENHTHGVYSSRRAFFKKAALALSGAALAGAILKPKIKAAANDSEITRSKDRGYRLTEHIRKYYEIASL